MLSRCCFIGKTINRTRKRTYIYIPEVARFVRIYTVWNHYRLRFKHLLLNKTPRREAGPGSVVRVRTAAPRFFPRLSLSPSPSPHSSFPVPRLFLFSFLLFLRPPVQHAGATSALSLSSNPSLSASLFLSLFLPSLSFGFPTAKRVESRGFSDTLYLAYFDLPEIH